MKLTEFQDTIGYTFHNEKLLQQALTHSSYANEHHLQPHSDNERLEFLGDSVLEVVSSRFLYDRYPDWPEGDLTRLRASLVSELPLAYSAREIHLGKFLRLAKGEDQTGGRERNSVLSDALEAVIGAIYLDGGIGCAKEFIFQFILTDIDHKKLFHDSKTRLQEIVQAKPGQLLEYVLVKEEGPDHAKRFTVEARLNGRVIGTGTDSSKKHAEQDAAYQGLLKLSEEADVS